MSQNKLRFFLNWKSVHDLSCTVKEIACSTRALFRSCTHFVPACSSWILSSMKNGDRWLFGVASSHSCILIVLLSGNWFVSAFLWNQFSDIVNALTVYFCYILWYICLKSIMKSIRYMINCLLFATQIFPSIHKCCRSIQLVL